MNARIRAVEARNHRMRAGTSFDTVTVDELMAQNHKLNRIAIYAMEKAGLTLSEADRFIVDKYTLLPRGEVERVMDSYQRLMADKAALEQRVTGLSGQLSTAQITASQLSTEASTLRQEKAQLEQDNMLLTAERDVYKERVKQTLDAGFRAKLRAMFTGLALGAVVAGGTVYAISGHGNDTPDADAQQETVVPTKSIMRLNFD